jgi:hypothetical protein
LLCCAARKQIESQPVRSAFRLAYGEGWRNTGWAVSILPQDFAFFLKNFSYNIFLIWRNAEMSIFGKAAAIVRAALVAASEPDDGVEPDPVRYGPLVILPAFQDEIMIWSPVYWLALGPVIFCYRPAVWTFRLFGFYVGSFGVFLDVDKAVKWGREV